MTMTMTIRFNADGTHDVVLVAPGDGTATPFVVRAAQPVLDVLHVRSMQLRPEVQALPPAHPPSPSVFLQLARGLAVGFIVVLCIAALVLAFAQG